MSKAEILEITLSSGRGPFQAIGSMSVIRTLSLIKEDSTDPVTKQNLQMVINMIYDLRPTI